MVAATRTVTTTVGTRKFFAAILCRHISESVGIWENIYVSSCRIGNARRSTCSCGAVKSGRLTIASEIWCIDSGEPGKPVVKT